MSETIQSVDGKVDRNNILPSHQSTEEIGIVGVAFQKLAGKLRGGSGEGQDIHEVLRGEGVIHDEYPENVVSLQVSRDAQEKLGVEVGRVARTFIEERMGSEMGQETESPININKNGDIIPSMEGETLSKNLDPNESLPHQLEPEEKAPLHHQVPEGQGRINEIVTSITKLEAEGRHEEVKQLETELQGIYLNQQTPPVPNTPIQEKQPEVSSTQEPEREKSPADTNDTSASVFKKIEELKISREGALADIRNTASATEPIKKIYEIDKQIEELRRPEAMKQLKKEAEEAPFEELAGVIEKADKILLDHSVIQISDAIEVKNLAQRRIAQYKKQTQTPKTPEESRQETIDKTKQVEVPDSKAHTKAVFSESIVSKNAENLVSEQLSQQPQDSSVEKSGGLSPEAEVPDAATHIKATSEHVEAPPLSPFEKAMGRVAAEDPARAERLFAAMGGATPEMREKMEKILGAVETLTQKIEVEKETKGEAVLNFLRHWGGRYQKLPLPMKLAVGGALIGGAFATGGTGILGSVFALGITARRGMVGLGTFVAIESIGHKIVDRSSSKDGMWKGHEKMAKNFSTAGALIGGILFGGAAKGLLEYYDAIHVEVPAIPVPPHETLTATPSVGEIEHSTILPNEISSPQEAADLKALREYAAAKTLEEKAEIAKIVGSTPEQMDIKAAALTGHAEHLEMNSKEIFENAQKEIHNTIPLPNEVVTEAENLNIVHEDMFGHAPGALEATYAVHEGDNLWNIIKEKIPEIQDLDGEGRQSNAIANIIEQIKKDPEGFGISGGDIDHLSAGDSINLEKVHGVLENAKISVGGHEIDILERAQGLTDIETSHIIENNAKIAEWHTAHPDAPLTTEAVDKILSGTADSTTIETNHLAEITKDYTLSMPDTGGRTIEQLSAEALTMDTDAVLHADVQTMFGSKGFFGYGFLGTNGEKSVDWLDLKDRPVSEVLSKQFVGASVGEEGGVSKFGIDSPGAVDKIKGYIKMLVERSGENPNPGESVEHFTKRGIGTILSKKQ